MYKTETHLHVAEVSGCSKLPAAEMIELYRKAGYTTVFVSDHFDAGGLRKKFGDIPWEEQITRFLAGYKAAREAGERLGMHVLLSAELKFNHSPNHYLLYGIDEAFLKNASGVFDMTAETFYPYAKEHGVTVVQAHPYRDGYNKPTPAFVDAFEVYNPNPRHENFDDKAIETARLHGKPMTAGSDTHRPEDVARTAVLSETPILCAADYVRLLMSGELTYLKWQEPEEQVCNANGG